MAAEASSDEELIRQADEEIGHERLLVAARFLEKVKNQDLLTKKHHTVIENAKRIQAIIDVHMVPAEEDSTWKKQAESHGNRDTMVYYRMDGLKLTSRIETPIESSLLVPLLATCNECELYQDWMPRWRIPFKMGVRESGKLKQLPARGAHVFQVTVDMPFPITDRQVVAETLACDAIDELGLIVMSGKSLEVGAEDGLVHPPDPGIKRIDFDVGWVIRKCPADHPCLKKSKHKYPEGEHLLLVGVTMAVDAHVSYVPQAFINFSTRTALSGQWGALLQVATDVKEGKRPDHDKVIQEKKELYGWVNQRIDAMFAKLEEEK